MVGYARILERWPNPSSQNLRMEESKHIGETWMDGCLGRPGRRKQFAQNYRLFGQTSSLLSKLRALPSHTRKAGAVGFQSWLTHARVRSVHVVLVGRAGEGDSTSPSADGKVARECQGPTKAGSA